MKWCNIFKLAQYDEDKSEEILTNQDSCRYTYKAKQNQEVRDFYTRFTFNTIALSILESSVSKIFFLKELIHVFVAEFS